MSRSESSSRMEMKLRRRNPQIFRVFDPLSSRIKGAVGVSIDKQAGLEPARNLDARARRSRRRLRRYPSLENLRDSGYVSCKTGSMCLSRNSSLSSDGSNLAEEGEDQNPSSDMMHHARTMVITQQKARLRTIEANHPRPPDSLHIAISESLKLAPINDDMQSRRDTCLRRARRSDRIREHRLRPWSGQQRRLTSQEENPGRNILPADSANVGQLDFADSSAISPHICNERVRVQATGKMGMTKRERPGPSCTSEPCGNFHGPTGCVHDTNRLYHRVEEWLLSTCTSAPEGALSADLTATPPVSPSVSDKSTKKYVTRLQHKTPSNNTNNNNNNANSNDPKLQQPHNPSCSTPSFGEKQSLSLQTDKVLRRISADCRLLANNDTTSMVSRTSKDSLGTDHFHQGQRARFNSIAKSPSPIAGNFIPVSELPELSSSSQDICSIQKQSPVEVQMDKLDPAHFREASPERFARGGKYEMEGRANTDPVKRVVDPKEAKNSQYRSRSRSPVKFGGFANLTPQKRQQTPAKCKSSGKKHIDSRNMPPKFSTTPSPTKQRVRKPSARYNGSPSANSIAGRRNVHPPAPINVAAAEEYARMRSPEKPIIIQEPPDAYTHAYLVPRRPTPPKPCHQAAYSESSCSSYSQDFQGVPSSVHISPLRVKKEPASPKCPNVLQDYSQWRNSPVVSGPKLVASSPANKVASNMPERPGTNASSASEPVFSPLNPFFRSHDFPADRKASKTMIGKGGWLERTSEKPEQKVSPRRKNFLENLMKKAKDMVDQSNTKSQRRSREAEKMQRRLAISLNPREQSLVYCELEFVLTTALNEYITVEFNAGRLDADKLRKISEGWLQKGRPKVLGFRYDLETQLDLVRLHTHDFRFYGRTGAAGAAAILGTIDAMRVNARSIRIRTFCQPDTVISKQLLDSQTLFEILGCPEQQQIQLAEIKEFFKAAMERERLFTERQSNNANAPSAGNAATNGGGHTSTIATTTPGATSGGLHQSMSQGEGQWEAEAALRHAKSHGPGQWHTDNPKARQTMSSHFADSMDPALYDSSLMSST